MLRLALAFAALLVAGSAHAASPGDPQVARGSYLVNRLGMCTDCHTSRDQTGALRRDAMLQGAPIDLQPLHPIPGFAKFAPPIAGMPANYTEAELVTFLETGKRPDGSFAAPPMPPYRMNPADAMAVAAYLRSLPR